MKQLIMAGNYSAESCVLLEENSKFNELEIFMGYIGKRQRSCTTSTMISKLLSKKNLTTLFLVKKSNFQFLISVPFEMKNVHCNQWQRQ